METPCLVHETVGRGLPRTRPSKVALPSCANLALRKICSKTGGEASPGRPNVGVGAKVGVGANVGVGAKVGVGAGDCSTCWYTIPCTETKFAKPIRL